VQFTRLTGVAAVFWGAAGGVDSDEIGPNSAHW